MGRLRSSNNNPASNALKTGVDGADVENAIKSSGYPLQLIVAQMLSANFGLREEWSYVDSDTDSIRTIDLVASKMLFEWQDPQPRTRPGLNLVVECKQSQLPYVFFLTEGYPRIPDFPVIAGLRRNKVVVTSDDDPSSWSYDPIQILELDIHEFLSAGAPRCITLSKCVRKGKGLELSGSDAYLGLVSPIAKAVQHFRKALTPPATAHYFDCELVIGLAVLDAPMIGVRVADTGIDTCLVPWVRVVRHQPCEAEHKFDREQTFGIDVVHKDFLVEYLDKHLLPFANDFASVVLKHQHVLADSKAFISGMGKNSWTDIETRLQPTSINTGGKRTIGALKKVLGFIR